MQETEEEEKRLIAACLKGNSASQQKLFDKFSGKMFAVCLRYAADSDQAKDLLQESFIRVFTKLQQFQFKGSFEGWIRRITIHTAIEHYRKEVKNRNVIDIEFAHHVGQEPNVLDKLQTQDLMQLINKLPLGYKTVFNLYVIDGYSHQEIATQLGISENTSKSQLRKARHFLINLLSNC